MRIEFHPQAKDELESSADWYAERSAAAARDFLVSVDLALKSIGHNPARFPRVDDHHRSCGVMKFPYQIVYRHDAERVFIIAVAHAKRRPGFWQGR
ncbi:MAG: type II toxin-antitoxin system RelE/ParE family toxin [Planctomycetaceae bacterium]|nr:type II toxin-antitoxin system RelE/ParE family toxin [Planctomycetaceae bacterium]MCB9954145.1 type II toxin-antitoxin system RelE/ParE family toxin [Planctomycetaceae bacterium]